MSPSKRDAPSSSSSGQRPGAPDARLAGSRSPRRLNTCPFFGCRFFWRVVAPWQMTHSRGAFSWARLCDDDGRSTDSETLSSTFARTSVSRSQLTGRNRPPLHHQLQQHRVRKKEREKKRNMQTRTGLHNIEIFAFQSYIFFTVFHSGHISDYSRCIRAVNRRHNRTHYRRKRTTVDIRKKNDRLLADLSSHLLFRAPSMKNSIMTSSLATTTTFP